MVGSDVSSAKAEVIAKADSAAAARRFGDALAVLNAAIQGGVADLDIFMRAAALHRANSEPRVALALVDRALAIEPLHFMALLMKAGLLEQLGEPNAAETYGMALAQMGATPVPPQMRPTIEHARQVYSAFAATSRVDLEEAMNAQLAQASPLERGRLSRFASNVARLTRVHHCEPTHFHFPGLPEYEFHDRSFFPWIEELEAASDAIRDELHAVMAAERAELVPYVQYHDTVPMQQWKALNESLDWTAIHLLFKGRRVEANARHCPKTLELLSRLPQPSLLGDAPNAMFSLLKAHTLIPPHHGVANFRLVCHLPLIVPDGCWFRVGSERRKWRVGEAFVFDDTIEHEAANESDELRVVLIFDVWHPALTALEREAISAALANGPKATGHL
jgi:aspartyl/asparaginyl beta-hydroxylase (cupin superfamily)